MTGESLRQTDTNFESEEKLMGKKTIMLVCAAGMSTSMLVKKMEDAATKDGIEAKIFALNSIEADLKKRPLKNDKKFILKFI